MQGHLIKRVWVLQLLAKYQDNFGYLGSTPETWNSCGLTKKVFKEAMWLVCEQWPLPEQKAKRIKTSDVTKCILVAQGSYQQGGDRFVSCPDE